MPVKAKRSALNYSLPITFNKAGELVNLFIHMYLFDMEEAAKGECSPHKTSSSKGQMYLKSFKRHEIMFAQITFDLIKLNQHE